MTTKIILSLILLITLSINTKAQNALTYTEVVQAEGVSKDILFNRAKIWLVETYNDAGEVIQIEDRDNGQIIGKAILEYEASFLSGRETVNGPVSYTIKILIKDGRYKYEIADFIHEPYGNQYGKYSVGLITNAEECPRPKKMAKKWSNRVWNDIKNQTESKMAILIASLKDGMALISEVESDDWK